MENILLTLLILAAIAALIIGAVKFHASRVRHANHQLLGTARRHREIVRQYREEQSRLTQ